MSPISHSQSIATKGLITGNAVSLASKGYIYIRIEDIPIPPKKKGGSTGELTKRFGKEKDKKKIVKVIVTYKNRKYIEAKVIDKKVEVTARDIDIELGDVPIITINVEGVTLDKKDIEEL